MLIVDDQRDEQDAHARPAHILGLQSTEVAEGETALSALKEASAEGDPFRIALVDMQMPGMDGEMLGSRIKSNPDLARTVLIMITSIGRMGDAKRVESKGFSGYLIKPVREAKLRDMVCLVADEKISPPQEKILTPCSVERPHTRILVAEDNATNQLVALKLLERLGYRADVVASGLEALHALSTIPYDLVLMDCQMPEMDGFEATRRIRRGEAGPGRSAVPIIAMTARAMQGDKEICLEAGMNDYVPKPVDYPTLANAVNRWLLPVTECSDAAPARKTDLAVFDKGALNDRLMGDETMIEEIISVFLADTPRRIEMLKERIAKGDAAGAGDEAHAIKGAVASIGGNALREIAFRMEKAGRSLDMERLVAMLPELEKGFDELRLVMGEGGS